MPYKVTIKDGGSTVGQWTWADKVFSSGKVGYFANGAVNVVLKAPRLTVKDDAGNTVVDCALPARVFKGVKGCTGWYVGGPDWAIATEEGLFSFSAQIITKQAIRTGAPVANRHRFQVMAYAA